MYVTQSPCKEKGKQKVTYLENQTKGFGFLMLDSKIESLIATSTFEHQARWLCDNDQVVDRCPIIQDRIFFACRKAMKIWHD